MRNQQSPHQNSTCRPVRAGCFVAPRIRTDARDEVDVDAEAICEPHIAEDFEQMLRHERETIAGRDLDHALQAWLAVLGVFSPNIRVFAREPEAAHSYWTGLTARCERSGACSHEPASLLIEHGYHA